LKARKIMKLFGAKIIIKIVIITFRWSPRLSQDTA